MFTRAMPKTTFSRDDVRTHVSGYSGPSLPAVNVKCHVWQYDFTDDLLRSVGSEQGYDPDEFVSWWHSKESDPDEFDRFLNVWWECAAESAWEDFQSDAEFIFDRWNVTVEQEGRSGGWLVLRGLPDVDEWDAVLLGKYRKFAKWCNSIVEAAPESIATLAAINSYESFVSEVEREVEQECKRSYFMPAPVDAIRRTVFRRKLGTDDD